MMTDADYSLDLAASTISFVPRPARPFPADLRLRRASDSCSHSQPSETSLPPPLHGITSETSPPSTAAGRAMLTPAPPHPWPGWSVPHPHGINPTQEKPRLPPATRLQGPQGSASTGRPVATESIHAGPRLNSYLLYRPFVPCLVWWADCRCTPLELVSPERTALPCAERRDRAPELPARLGKGGDLGGSTQGPGRHDPVASAADGLEMGEGLYVSMGGNMVCTLN